MGTAKGPTTIESAFSRFHSLLVAQSFHELARSPNTKARSNPLRAGLRARLTKAPSIYRRDQILEFAWRKWLGLKVLARIWADLRVGAGVKNLDVCFVSC